MGPWGFGPHCGTCTILKDAPDAKVFRLHEKGNNNKTADNAHLLLSVEQATLWLVMSEVTHQWELTTPLAQILLEAKGKRLGEASIFNEYMPTYEHDWEDAEFGLDDYKVGPRIPGEVAAPLLPKAAAQKRPPAAKPVHRQEDEREDPSDPFFFTDQPCDDAEDVSSASPLAKVRGRTTSSRVVQQSRHDLYKIKAFRRDDTLRHRTMSAKTVLADPDHRTLVNVVRSIGILQVVLFHVLFGVFSFASEQGIANLIATVPSWMTFAWHTYGVDAIFMVSAFLLTLSLLDNIDRNGSMSLRAYYVRRVSRILPLYFVALILFQLATEFEPVRFALSALFLGVTFGLGNVIPVGWSMEVMMQFYLALPLFIALAIRSGRPLAFVAGLGLAATIGRVGYLIASGIDPMQIVLDIYQGHDPSLAASDLYYKLWFRIAPFFVGVGLAFALLHQPAPKKSTRMIFAFAGAALIIAAFGAPVHDEHSWFYAMPRPALVTYFATGIVVFALGLALLLFALLTGPAPYARPFSRLFQKISSRIFGIYLFHMAFLLLAAVIVLRSTDKASLDRVTALDIWLIAAVTIAVSYGFAGMILKFIEAPLQRYLRKKLD